jgi:hypothetical protein
VQLRIQEGVRVGQIDIDVVALTMVDLQHQAVPPPNDQESIMTLFGVDLTDRRAGDRKEACLVWSVRVHDASG